MTATSSYEFRLAPDEMARVHDQMQRRRSLAWIAWAAWPLLVVLAVLALVYGTGWRQLIWPLGGLALFLLGLQLLAPRLHRRQLERAFAATPALGASQVYRVSDSGLALTGGANGMTLGWEALVDAVETEEFFVLFMSKRHYLTLPKRAVGDERDRQALRTLLCDKLGGRATGLRQGEPSAPRL